MIFILCVQIVTAVIQVNLSKDSCTCVQATTQLDCTAIGNCEWNTTNSACSKSSSTAVVVISYCTTISLQQCHQTLGCALVAGTSCQLFTGCQVYSLQTNSQCQAVSIQCTSDGVRCMEKQACNQYPSTNCAERSSNSGSGTCKVSQGTCVDQQCSDAPITYNTNSSCNGFIPECVTNGSGCVSVLLSCSTYQSNDCSKYIGVDGTCKQNTATTCQVSACADGQYSTNAQCQKFKPGCITNGNSCVTTLSPCSTYSSALDCLILIGSDGPCFNDQNSTNCRVRQCTDNSSSRTDSDCNAFMTGCVTTGLGCIAQLGLCSTMTGTIASCTNFTGFDGPCKGMTATIGNCAQKLCTDAPAMASNADCNNFLKGCVTTGKGCASQLGPCASYLSQCDGLIGSDGACTGTGPCRAKLCNDAPSQTSNQACQSYQPTCVSTGTACIQFTTCNALSLKISCQGSSSCYWNQFCMRIISCSSFTNASLCNANLANGIQCAWVGSSCQQQTCPIGLTTDILCSAAVPGCVFDGSTGCTANNSPCSSFFGDNTTGPTSCMIRNPSCVGLTTTIQPCVSKSCSNYPTNGSNTTNTQCSQYLASCVSDNYQGCVNKLTDSCSSYYGTQAACDKISATSANVRCFNTISATSNTPCYIKTINDIVLPVITIYPVAYTDSQCALALSGTMSSQIAVSTANPTQNLCIPASTPCTSLNGSFDMCVTYFGSNGNRCYKTFGFCYSKSPANCQGTVASSQAQCTAASTNCLYIGNPMCAYVGPCSSYNTQNFVICQTLFDQNNQPCTYISGQACSSVSYCTQYQIEDPIFALTYCNSLKDAFNNSCTASIGDFRCSYNISLSNSLISPFNYCSNYSYGNICQPLTCEALTGTFKSHLQCQQLNPLCYWNGYSACITKYISCGSYPAPSLGYCATVKAQSQQCIGQTNYGTSPLTYYCSQAYFQLNLVPCVVIGYINGTSCPYFYPGSWSFSGVSQICSYKTGLDPATPDANRLICIQNLDLTYTSCGYSGSSFCTAAPTTCEQISFYSPPLAIDVICQSYVIGLICGAASQTSLNCSPRTCSDYFSLGKPQSEQDCQSYLSSCYWTGAECAPNPNKTCWDYITLPAIGPSVCNGRTDRSGFLCTYITGDITCSARKCEQQNPATSTAQCQSWAANCLWDGNASCIQILKSCYQYSVTSCSLVYDSQGRACTSAVGTSKCVYPACSSITGASSYSDCAQVNPSCNYISGSCFGQSCLTILAQGTDNQSKLAFCQNYTDTLTGVQCFYTFSDVNGNSPLYCSLSGPNNCQYANYGISGSEQDCNNFSNGCTVFPPNGVSLTACSPSKCEHNKTAQTDNECQNFLQGCVTNGNGCFEPTVTCDKYQGTDKTCSDFTGNGIPCYNYSTIVSSCIPKTCIMNTTAITDQECDDWYPTDVTKCVFNGTAGCVPYATCSIFTGSKGYCSNLKAIDGPCKIDPNGTCTSRLCTDAPNTFQTDSYCSTYSTDMQTCVTTGYGCVDVNHFTCGSIVSNNACTSSSHQCSWVNQCSQVQQNCASYTSFGSQAPSQCVQIAGCSWDFITNVCRESTCSDLSDNFVTNSQCQTLDGCTSDGEGCTEKAPCSTYTTQSVCQAALTTDPTPHCFWQSSNGICRMLQCEDLNGVSDTLCNSQLANCKSNGVKCLTQPFKCSMIIKSNLCITDSSKSPCLWVNGACYNFTQCSDVSFTTYSICQQFSTNCTTNGTKCIPLGLCSSYGSNAASCQVGIDGACGLLPGTTPICQVFTKCSDAIATTTEICQLYGKSCYSDGSTCITKQLCMSYGTQTGCSNGGTDGACIWDTSIGKCRLQVCGDVTSAYDQTSNLSCSKFPASSVCTTNGITCIPRSSCSSYSKSSCFQGTDGQCIYSFPLYSNASNSTQSCRALQCQDAAAVQSSLCATAVSAKCVSNGATCIPMSTCASYINKEACNGGGTDGVCAFRPSANILIGTCIKVNQCTDAGPDSIACSKFPSQCYYRTRVPLSESTCVPQTCQSKQIGSTCYPVPNFNLTSYTICNLSSTNNTCIPTDGSQLSKITCFSASMGTYVWNVTSAQCTYCGKLNDTNISSTTNTTTNIAPMVTSFSQLFGCILIYQLI